MRELEVKNREGVAVVLQSLLTDSVNHESDSTTVFVQLLLVTSYSWDEKSESEKLSLPLAHNDWLIQLMRGQKTAVDTLHA